MSQKKQRKRNATTVQPAESVTATHDPQGLPALPQMLEIFAELYPNPQTELHHGSPFQLLIATILSAQSTDVGVNQVSPALFAAFPDATAMSSVEPEALHSFINRLGLYRNKARALVATATMLRELYDGQVPRTHEELMKLPGVGRKTANVVLSCAFGIPAIAVDTHVFRVSQRLGIAFGSSPDVIEEQLMKVIPQSLWSDAHHWLILHGRRVCTARSPKCAGCRLATCCPKMGLDAPPPAV